MPPWGEPADGVVAAEALSLAKFLAVPLIGLLVLAVLRRRRGKDAAALTGHGRRFPLVGRPLPCDYPGVGSGVQ